MNIRKEVREIREKIREIDRQIAETDDDEKKNKLHRERANLLIDIDVILETL